MGVMIDGVWHEREPERSAGDGRFERPDSALRSWITPDGEPGPSGRGGYRAEAGRYHLYIAEGCPWAHRTWIYRVIEGLEEAIPMSISCGMGAQGWAFDPGSKRYRDPLHGARHLHELYARGAERYSGRVTVPVLWDTRTDRIVSNESSEIIRMLDTAFDEVTGRRLDLYPTGLREEIDAWNERIYRGLNNGVYRAGLATSQEAHDEAVIEVFATLDELERHLSTRRYLCGARITEADWRLFPTLVRFDSAYVSAFRCNLRRLVDYPELWGYTRDLYQQPGIAQTVRLDAYRRGYHAIPLVRHPLGIVPRGPLLDLSQPHGRTQPRLTR